MRSLQIAEFLTATLLVCVCPFPLRAQTSQSLSTVPLQGVTLQNSLNATTNPVTISIPAGTNTLFHPANPIAIDNEYFVITAVAPGTLTAVRAQFGSVANIHAAGSQISQVYQLEVLLASPNASIGAYQVTVSYDRTKLAIVPDNVFPVMGTPLGTPVAVNTKTPGTIILNSYNATTAFSGNATPVARLFFTATGGGTTGIGVNLDVVADTLGNDLTIPNGLTAGPSATPSVSSVTVVKRGRGQVTSQ